MNVLSHCFMPSWLFSLEIVPDLATQQRSIRSKIDKDRIEPIDPIQRLKWINVKSGKLMEF